MNSKNKKGNKRCYYCGSYEQALLDAVVVEEMKEKESLNTSKANRVEVINHTQEGNGREYVFKQDKAKVYVDLQDDGRTLKIFIDN